MVVQLLKQSTLPIHKRVEARLDLLDPCLSPGRLNLVIQRFYGFWTGNEDAIAAWALTDPVMASAIRWDRRRRDSLFSGDLVNLGLALPSQPSVPRAPPVFEHIDTAEVLGWLYVTEGSTLGGAVIDRHLRTMPELFGIGIESFTPYPEGPSAMWRSYKSVLQDFAFGHADRTAAVNCAAVATFEALDRWLLPLGLGAAS